MKSKKKKGFTLTELIVVIVIIGVLAAVLIPSLTGYITKAQNTKDETLVISLNRELDLRKIENDNLNFYTAYDVQSYLESVGMSNIEVANKDNIILFDAEINQFVLIKENEKDDVFYIKEGDTKKLNNEGELILNPTEYYRINHHYYDEETEDIEGGTLITNKCNNESCNTHRTFIVSTNGSEMAKASSEFMNLNYGMTSDELKDLYNNFNGYKDVNVRTLALNSISKTLFIDNVNGNNKAFYLSVEKVNNEYTYVKKEFNGGGQPTQVLTRVITTGNVTSLDLDLVDELQRSTIFISGSVESVKETDSLGELINLVGNTLNIEKLTNSIEADYQLAMVNLNIKEITYVNSYVKNETELRDLISKYKEITAEGSAVKTEIEALVSKYPNITKWWENCNVIVNDSFAIKDEITIPEGVILTIPYDSNGSYDSDGHVAEIIKLKESDTKSLAYTLTLNKTMIIEGKVIVGGITGYDGAGLNGHTSSTYSQIINNKEIIVEQTGLLDVYGYIIGEGKVSLNGGTLIEPLIIGDYGGGWNTAYALLLDSKNSPHTPFSQYAIANIWCDIIVDSNSLFACRGKICADGKAYKFVANMISSNSVQSLIKLEDGSKATLTYDPNKKIADTYKSIQGVGKTTIKVNGSCKTGSFEIDMGEIDISDKLSSLGGLGSFIGGLTKMSLSADTATFVLPLPYLFDFELTDGEFEICSKIAIFPGCNVSINGNSSLKIIKGAEVYIVGEEANGISYSGYLTYPTTEQLIGSNSEKSNFEKTGRMIVENVNITVEGLLAGNIEVKDNCASTIYIDSDTGNCILEGKHKECQKKEEHLICTKKICLHLMESCYACGENPNNIDYINSGCCEATYTNKTNITLIFGADNKILDINFVSTIEYTSLFTQGKTYSYDSTSNSWKEKTE